MRSIRFPDGREVQVGWQPDASECPKFLHRFLMPRGDEQTVLEFALSREACLALVELYAQHELLPDLAALTQRAEQAKRERDEAREYVRGFIPLTEHMSELDAAMFVEDARIWLERMDCAATLHTPAPEQP